MYLFHRVLLIVSFSLNERPGFLPLLDQKILYINSGGELLAYF